MNLAARDVVYVVVRAMFAVLALFAALRGDYEAAVIAMVGLVLSVIPSLVLNRLHLKLPLFYEIIVLGFIVASIMMGEVFDAYARFWWWDSMLHLSSGVIIGYIGFIILYVLYRQGRLNVSSGMIAFLTFSVSMMVAAMWEVTEFTIDKTFGATMQHGNGDTMKDIILAMVGSLVATGAAYWHHRWPETSPLRNQLTDFTRRNADLISAKNPLTKKK